MDGSDVYEKPAHSPAAAAREQAALRLLAGPGVVPVVRDGEEPPPRCGAGRGPVVVRTRRGRGSLADVLRQRRRLPEAECRGVGVAVARALAHVHARGWVHGDVKPANVIVAPDTTLWLADFDSAAPAGHPRRRGTPARGAGPGPLDPAADLVALAVLVTECATGVVIDPTAPWPAPTLVSLGSPPRLGADLAALLTRPTTARAAVTLLDRGVTRLPSSPAEIVGSDLTPTLDFESTALAGLSPASSREEPG